jgi:hypothetical protein
LHDNPGAGRSVRRNPTLHWGIRYWERNRTI